MPVRSDIEQELTQSREHFEGAFVHAALGIALVAPDGRWLRGNPKLCETVGYAEEELQSLTFQDVIHPDDLDEYLEQVGRMLTGEISAYHLEKRYVKKDGSVVWVLLSVSLVRDAAGEPSYFVAQVQDITERKRLEERLEHLAYHDSLTGLPNRALLRECLERALARADREGTRVALLYLDLDGFKAINDSLGHETGDRLLAAVARRLRARARVGDTVARLGGDEFCVLAEDIRDADEAGRVVERVRRGLREPFSVSNDRVLRVAASIGVAVKTPEKLPSADRLLREADAAMYREKNRGGGSVARELRGLPRDRR